MSVSTQNHDLKTHLISCCDRAAGDAAGERRTYPIFLLKFLYSHWWNNWLICQDRLGTHMAYTTETNRRHFKNSRFTFHVSRFTYHNTVVLRAGDVWREQLRHRHAQRRQLRDPLCEKLVFFASCFKCIPKPIVRFDRETFAKTDSGQPQRTADNERRLFIYAGVTPPYVRKNGRFYI